MPKLLHNATNDVMCIQDLFSITLQPNEVTELNNLPPYDVQASLDLITLLVTGQATLSDGTRTLTVDEAVNVIRGYIPPMTVDGKKMVMATPRVVDTYAYFTGSGDNAAIGNGTDFLYTLQPNETITKESSYLEDIHFLEGRVTFDSAAIGSYIEMDLVAPARKAVHRKR